jgi:hypothetical protein
MFVIRKAQIERMAALRLSRFVKRMVSLLQRFYPDWSSRLSPTELEEFVRVGMLRAENYGLTTELELARYLQAMRALGRNFDKSEEHPWAGELLRRDIPAGDKVQRLMDAVFYQTEARRILNAR